MITLIVVFWIGVLVGVAIMAIISINRYKETESCIKKKTDRINSQVEIIFALRRELVKAKGAAASEETSADLLKKLKDELQSDYDKLLNDHKEMLLEYKKLYIELDRIKAAEVRKFRTPEEIGKELSTIEEMLINTKPKVLLAG